MLAVAMMNFFKQYPMMSPYVGTRFRDAVTPSILLIGESHFLDEETPQRMNPEAWYSGSSATLEDYDISFISTTKLLTDATADNFPKPTHVIYSNPFWEINECGPQYSDYRLVAEHVAFYNFFLRPAVDGASLEYDPTFSIQDLEIANEAFCQIVAELIPTAVVFLSKFAYGHCAASLLVPVIPTPHPGCAHWNKVCASYGNKRGRDILGDFVKSTNWPKSSIFK